MTETSQKQLEANRQNAKLGGVKTDKGKAVSKYNALKHGILSKEVALADEDKKALLELVKKIRQELDPASELELVLVDRITANIWRLRRVIEIERKTMSWQYNRNSHFNASHSDHWENDEDIDEQSAGAMVDNDIIEKLMRYEITIERSIYKALHELQRLQARRQGQEVPAPLAVDVEISKEE